MREPDARIERSRRTVPSIYMIYTPFRCTFLASLATIHTFPFRLHPLSLSLSLSLALSLSLSLLCVDLTMVRILHSVRNLTSVHKSNGALPTHEHVLYYSACSGVHVKVHEIVRTDKERERERERDRPGHRMILSEPEGTNRSAPSGYQKLGTRNALSDGSENDITCLASVRERGIA